MAKIGDTVRFLNSIGGGRITRIEGNVAHVEDADGFEVPMLLKECVVVMEAAKQKAVINAAEDTTRPKSPTSSQPETPSKYQAPPQEELPLMETDYGEKINIELAFEPIDIKKLSSAGFHLTLVNDSNYYISYIFATRATGDSQWTFRYSETVAPNIMSDLGNYFQEDLNSLEHILFQYIAYKVEKDFTLKQPASIELHVDTTKFCKLHCFRDSLYFDEPVLAFPLVTDDKPYTPLKVSAKQIEAAINEKKRIDRPAARPVQKRKPKKGEPLVVDLHIHELVDSTNGMSNAEMLNLQVDEFRRAMDSNLRNHGQKIIFIHGKGEGVLRKALLKELSHRYKGHDVCDASFQEYGFGATQVTIH